MTNENYLMNVTVYLNEPADQCSFMINSDEYNEKRDKNNKFSQGQKVMLVRWKVVKTEILVVTVT